MEVESPYELSSHGPASQHQVDHNGEILCIKPLERMDHTLATVCYMILLCSTDALFPHGLPLFLVFS